MVALCSGDLKLYSDASSIVFENADLSGRAVQGVGLQRFAWWDGGFESLSGHACLSLVIVVCCQVEVSASG